MIPVCAPAGNAPGWCRGRATLRLQGFSKCGGGFLSLTEGFQANADLRHGLECKGNIQGGEGKLLQRILMQPALLERQAAFVGLLPVTARRRGCVVPARC
jgi:hypothetical protein